MTGQGRLEVCSKERNRALFDAVLAGVGQYGIIVRAKIRLVPAKTRALDHSIRYDDLATFMADLRTLVAREELDMVWGGIKRDLATHAWYYELYTTSFYDPPGVPDSDHLLRGLSFEAQSPVVIDGTYYDYVTRVDMGIAFLQSIGVWDGFMKPWYDVYIPNHSFEPYLADLVPSLAPEDVGNFGFVLLFPLKRSTISQPMFRIPDDDLVFLFDITTSANTPGFDPTFAAEMRARNRAWFEEARAIGATRYPIGSLDFTEDDWRQHYGPEWFRARVSKTFFDPDGILTPGPGIFPNG
ncbi:MAG: hypothetical protein H5U40_15175 [Polyangiaceae bacterium]|nr:hypothetical protein [Polyangiaceae bacterium]